MRRMQLLELEDQSWLPAVLRDGLTDSLTFLATLSNLPYRSVARRLKVAMERTGDKRIVDMGSGGGGPAVALGQLLDLPGLEIVLTDLYPNVARLKLNERRSVVPVRVVEQGVDATAVPSDLPGFRIMCNAFHHLPPEAAIGCLADAVRQRQGIGVFEWLDPNPLLAIPGQLLLPILVVSLVSPLIPPFRLGRVLLTWGLPLLPLTILFDGLVSYLRVYSPDELRELVAKVPGAEGYDWEIGYVPLGEAPGRATCLFGTPKVG